jgi:RHS repeat-associated protein
MGCQKLTYHQEPAFSASWKIFSFGKEKSVSTPNFCIDYYAYGMQMPGRFGGESARYGFNGMEKDDEVKGEGNSYTTEFRQYDPRVGRWLSIDPLFKNFPWQSPYVAFDNNPIINNDPKGAAAENQTDGPGDRKKKLKAKQKSLKDKAFELPLSKQKRKIRLDERAAKIGEKIKDLRDKSREKGGIGKSSAVNNGQNGGTSGNGAGSDDDTPPLSVDRPSPTQLTNTDYSIGPGQVIPAPTRNTENYRAWADYSRANPSAIISIWGGGNTPIQSRANATQIRNDLENAGVNPANINVLPLSNPPPPMGSIPNGPSLW